MSLGSTLKHQNVSSGADSFALVGRDGQVFPVGQSSRVEDIPFLGPEKQSCGHTP
jgi:hypothetical protein